MSVHLPSSISEIEALLTSTISARASHIRESIESLSLADVRRLLEEDLGLEKFQLDVHKLLIRKIVDEVLVASDGSDHRDQEEIKEDFTANNSDERNLHDKTLSRKKQNLSSSEKKRKDKELSKAQADISEECPKNKKQRQEIKGLINQNASSVDESDEEKERSHLSDSDSDSSVEKKLQKGRITSDVKLVHSKKVEQLKTVIKACGLNIPPSIYKKVKQASESNQESILIKELKGILSREGLSSNPTEKEIRGVKRRKDREKDLEGIDTTNIILEPRGRRAAAAGFFGPPKYVEPVHKDESERDTSSSPEQSSDDSPEEDAFSD
eukprot:c19523_g1_i1 orf=644-1618(-)